MKPILLTAAGNPENQDRGLVVHGGARVVLCVADGAGGRSGGHAYGGRMKKIDYFNQDPKGDGWLANLNLKVGQLVLVEGHTYRYSQDRGGLDHILTPVEPLRNKP